MNLAAYNRMADWVKSRELIIRKTRPAETNPPCITHWIQCASNPNYMPLLPGDSRVTTVFVPEQEQIT